MLDFEVFFRVPFQISNLRSPIVPPPSVQKIIIHNFMLSSLSKLKSRLSVTATIDNLSGSESITCDQLVITLL
jgi:hypothetical protein